MKTHNQNEQLNTQSNSGHCNDANEVVIKINGVTFYTLTSYASMFNVNVAALRRYVKTLDDNMVARKIGGIWFVAASYNFTLAIQQSRSRSRSRRADGRRRYIVYANRDELDAILSVVSDSNVVDANERARERRERRKNANANA